MSLIIDDKRKIHVSEYTPVHVKASAEGYRSKERDYIVISDMVDHIVLNQPTDMHTFTINPTPSDAVVTLTAAGAIQQGNSITVSYGTLVNWTVSKDGYETKIGREIVIDNVTKNITIYDNDTYYVFTITPVPINAEVILLAEGYLQEGNSITVLKNTTVSWKVKRNGYITKSGIKTVTEDETYNIILDPEERNYTLTINPTPSNATVILTADGYTQEDNTITVLSGTTVSYIISAPGYITKSGTIIVSADLSESVSLDPNYEYYTYIINPTPIDATVTLSAAGAVQEDNSITVLYNSEVTWTVSKVGYETKSGSKRIVENTIDNIELVSQTEYYTYTVNVEPSTALVTLIASGYTQNGNSITVPYGTEVSWIIENEGYISQSGVKIVNNTSSDSIVLVPVYHTLTINPTPSDSIVTLTASGYVQEGNLIRVPYGTSVSWNVRRAGYVSQSDDIVVVSDTTHDVLLTNTIYSNTSAGGFTFNTSNVSYKYIIIEFAGACGCWNGINDYSGRGSARRLSFSDVNEISISGTIGECLFNTGVGGSGYSNGVAGSKVSTGDSYAYGGGGSTGVNISVNGSEPVFYEQSGGGGNAVVRASTHWGAGGKGGGVNGGAGGNTNADERVGKDATDETGLYNEFTYQGMGYINIILATITYTINPTPADAKVTLVANGYTQIGNSISVRENTPISYIVSKDGYVAESGIRIINEDTVDNISLTPEHEYYTYTINPNPSNAAVTLVANGYTQIGNSITVLKDTVVDYTVTLSGYESQYGSKIITSDLTETINLLPIATHSIYLYADPVSANITVKVNNVIIATGVGSIITAADKDDNVEYTVEFGGASKTKTITMPNNDYSDTVQLDPATDVELITSSVSKYVEPGKYYCLAIGAGAPGNVGSVAVSTRASNAGRGGAGGGSGYIETKYFISSGENINFIIGTGTSLNTNGQDTVVTNASGEIMRASGGKIGPLINPDLGNGGDGGSGGGAGGIAGSKASVSVYSSSSVGGRGAIGGGNGEDTSTTNTVDFVMSREGGTGYNGVAGEYEDDTGGDSGDITGNTYGDPGLSGRSLSDIQSILSIRDNLLNIDLQTLYNNVAGGGGGGGSKTPPLSTSITGNWYGGPGAGGSGWTAGTDGVNNDEVINEPGLGGSGAVLLCRVDWE